MAQKETMSVKERISAVTAAIRRFFRTKPMKVVRKIASLIGKGSDIIMDIDMVGTDMATAQGMCGASSGSIPTDVGQPLIRVSSITVGGR